MVRLTRVIFCIVSVWFRDDRDIAGIEKCFQNRDGVSNQRICEYMRSVITVYSQIAMAMLLAVAHEVTPEPYVYIFTLMVFLSNDTHTLTRVPDFRNTKTHSQMSKVIHLCIHATVTLSPLRTPSDESACMRLPSPVIQTVSDPTVIT